VGRRKEPLDGGLWTAADPGTLEPGQLQDIRNAVYLPGSRALHRSPGRSSFGAVSANGVVVDGLRDLQFDNSDHYLVALASSTLKTAPVGDAGSFTTLTTIATDASQLESAHFNNRFYLFTGLSASASAIGSNVVAYLSATAAGTSPQVRQHGMLPVVAAPASASAGVTFSQTVTGFYEYWTTEVAKISADGVEQAIESTFVGAPATVFVSSTTYSPVIVQPAIRNTGFATHWRVYRSPKKTFETDKEFPIGFMIAEQTIATGAVTATITDGGTSQLTSYAFPTTYNTAGMFAADFTTPTNLGADDGANATRAHNSLVPTLYGQLCYGFNFGGFKGPVRGIEVEIQGQHSTNSRPVSVTVCKRNPVSFQPMAPQGTKGCQINDTLTTVLLGSPTDLWNYPAWSDADFDTNFAVVIQPMLLGTSTSILFDYVRVRVYYGTTNIYSTIQFPTVIYTFGDISAQVGKNGPPPSSSTGDVYEDQLVVNDVSNRSLVRYSAPGDPEAFPETYFVDFETSENDIITAIKVVNDNLIVWLRSSSWRMNYLPSERDASFDRGKSKKVISSSYGCVDPMCVAVFCPDGASELAMFVSNHGIHYTDGYNFRTITDDLDTSKFLPPNATPIALTNDRSRNILTYFFSNISDFGAETHLGLSFAYGGDFWKGGMPTCCGYTHMRNNNGAVQASLESAWPVQRSNGAVSTYLGYGGSDTSVGAGKVYIEIGTDMPALDPRISYITREMFEADPGGEWQLGDLYGYAHSYGGLATAPTFAYTPKTRKTNDTGLVTQATKPITLSGQKLHKAGVFRVMCESASISVVATASAVAAEFLILDGKDFGLEDSGKS
jgi:hypothetical protein